MATLPAKRRGRQYVERPAACRLCASRASWNGTRIISSMKAAGPGEVVRKTDVVRWRARCSSKPRDCSAKDWTVYEDGGYPHRTFELDVVANAVAAVEVGEQSMTAAAATHMCTRHSVRRWRRWMATLVAARALEQLCARLDPTTTTGQGRRSGSAATVLGYLERLAALLAQAGVSLPRAASGLGRILRHQLERFGEVFHLTKSSPPLRADGGAEGL